ncbi:MAG: SDR family oxidoreductase [Actinomycetota bacterium]|nr:SDR family oxidoreductase [Actinomycetota bacterium]
MTERLNGRRILVSGGTSGIGAASAGRLTAEGGRVWILGSCEESLQRALAQLNVAGGSVCDVTDEPAVERATAQAAQQLGGLDGAFVNAGIDGQGANVVELSADHFRRVLDVNVVGVFLVARASARLMGHGSAIVVNASVNGLRAERDFADYNASKAAVISVAQTMALELAERGITVSSICPGYIRTPMTAPYLNDAATAEQLLEQIPAGRFGTPEEIGALVAFLLSADAGYMTGAVISVDGGRSV